MDSPLFSATVQGTVLCVASNLLAQTLQSYRDSKPFSIDFTQLLQFIMFTILSTPPNFLFQQFLEDTFPGYVVQKPAAVANGKAKDDKLTSEKSKLKDEIVVPEKRLNLKNTVIKFALDQTVGAVFNTLGFVAGMPALRGANKDEIMSLLRKDTIPLMLAGYKLWPLVSILNYTVVPFEYRMLFGGLVGIGWGIFLSLFVAG